MLAFVGAKMLLVDVYRIPVLVSLRIVAAVLAVAVGASLLKPAGRAGAGTRVLMLPPRAGRAAGAPGALE